MSDMFFHGGLALLVTGLHTTALSITPELDPCIQLNT